MFSNSPALLFVATELKCLTRHSQTHMHICDTSLIKHELTLVQTSLAVAHLFPLISPISAAVEQHVCTTALTMTPIPSAWYINKNTHYHMIAQTCNTGWDFRTSCCFSSDGKSIVAVRIDILFVCLCIHTCNSFHHFFPTLSQNIFLGEDIRKQLPRESAEFDDVNFSWKTIMDRLNKDKNALRGTQHPGKNEGLSHATWRDAESQQLVTGRRRAMWIKS